MGLAEIHRGVTGCVAAVLCTGACTGPAASSGQVVVEAVCSQRGFGSRIGIAIRNQTNEHVSILVGFILGNGDQLPQAISLRFKRLQANEPDNFGYSHPAYAVVAGRMDPWLLELGAGRSFTFEVPAHHFLSREGDRLSTSRHRGEATVVLRGLEFESWPGLKPTGLWTGFAESAPIRVPGDCERAANGPLQPTSGTGRRHAGIFLGVNLIIEL